MSQLSLLILCIILLHSTAKPTSNNLVLEVVDGQDIFLPCNLRRMPGENIVIWRKGERVLFAGDLRVRRDLRFDVLNNDLVIKESHIEDSGDYVCEIERENGDLEALAVTLKVLKPATAEIEIGSHLTLKSETSLAVTCSGYGVPTPEVKWTRGNVVIASGTALANLVLEKVSKDDIGDYVCEAFNSVGDPDTETLILDVLYPPVVELSTPEILFQPKCGLELKCLVHSSSPPSVTWFHNNLLLHPRDGVTMWSLDNLHVLQIHSCDQQILGHFTCKAESNLGYLEDSVVIKEEFIEEKMEEETMREYSANNVRRNVEESLPLVSSAFRQIFSFITILISISVIL